MTERDFDGLVKIMPDTSINGESSSTPPKPDSAPKALLPEALPDDPFYSTNWQILPVYRGKGPPVDLSKPPQKPPAASTEPHPEERERRVQEARTARRLAAARRRDEQAPRVGRARKPLQDSREGTSTISRAQAQQIARDYATVRGRPIIADEAVVLDLDDLDRRGVRRPVVYAVDLRDAWIVYALEERPIIRSSTIVAVSKTTGEVLYVGSAHDEG